MIQRTGSAFLSRFFKRAQIPSRPLNEASRFSEVKSMQQLPWNTMMRVSLCGPATPALEMVAFTGE